MHSRIVRKCWFGRYANLELLSRKAHEKHPYTECQVISFTIRTLSSNKKAEAVFVCVWRNETCEIQKCTAKVIQWFGCFTSFEKTHLATAHKLKDQNYNVFCIYIKICHNIMLNHRCCK